MVAAKSIAMLDLQLKRYNDGCTYACMRVLTLSKGNYVAISMIVIKLDTRSLRKLFERA